MTTRSEDYLEGYLVGEELIRVILEHHHIALIFQEYGIQIFGVVNFVTNENEQHSINARNKDTNLALLWKSIGKSVVEFRRKNGLYMKLSDSSVIWCDSLNNSMTGTIQTLDLKTYEEF